MNRLLFNVFQFLLLVALSCTACQRPMFEDAEEIEESGTRMPLKVQTRSESDQQVDYPAYIFVFDTEDGSYVDECTLTDADDETLDLELLPGKYTVVAVAGVKKGYELPQKPDLKDVVAMTDNNRSEQAMMMGSSSITIENEKEASLNITLYYTVASIEVILSDIPSSTDKVNFQLAPLYSAIGFNGVYAGEGKDTEVECTRGGDGIWRTEPFYVFPGSGDQTSFSITLEDGNETETYGYTFKGHPEAKVPLKIKGSYKGQITISGNLTVGGWEETEEVSFDFGPQAEEGNGGNEEDNTQSGSTEFPEVGDFWEGGIVVYIEDAETKGFNILQMNTGEWTTLAANIDELLDEIDVDSSWELPATEEAHFLNAAFGGENLSKINEKITALDEDYPPLQAGDERYLFYNEFEELKGFGFKEKPNVGNPGKDKIYRVRLIRWIHYDTE